MKDTPRVEGSRSGILQDESHYVISSSRPGGRGCMEYSLCGGKPYNKLLVS